MTDPADQQSQPAATTAFVCRLIPPRPTFMTSLSSEEYQTMLAHARYWSELMQQGRVIAFGPVSDPQGPYGLGIVLAADAAEVQALCDRDPAILSPHGLRTEIAPMRRLITPQGVYEGPLPAV